jgi:hypothetical protein
MQQLLLATEDGTSKANRHELWQRDEHAALFCEELKDVVL